MLTVFKKMNIWLIEEGNRWLCGIFFSYKIQDRKDEVWMIVSSRRLFEAYTMIELSRLKYIKTHKKQLRAKMYKALIYAILHAETNPTSEDKWIMLSSSFTGGIRYILQNYQDAMVICKWTGYSNLFITFTCNP